MYLSILNRQQHVPLGRDKDGAVRCVPLLPRLPRCCDSSAQMAKIMVSDHTNAPLCQRGDDYARKLAQAGRHQQCSCCSDLGGGKRLRKVNAVMAADSSTETPTQTQVSQRRPRKAVGNASLRD